MKKNNRTILLVFYILGGVFLVAVASLSCPAPAMAFLAASGISLIAATLFPQLLFFLLNILLTIIAFIKRKKALTVFLLVLLVAVSVYFTKRYLCVKHINATPVVNSENIISEEEEWEAFKSSVFAGQSGELWFDFLDAGNDYLEKNQVLEITTYDPEKYVHIIGYTLVADFSLKETTINLAGDFFIEVFNLAFNGIKLEEFLTEKGIAKSDEILIYCPSGSTSRVVAFILNHYGYKVHYLPLAKVENLGFTGEIKNLFIIQSIREDQVKDEQYIFFMLTINDYYHNIWSQYLCRGDSFPDNLHFYKVNDENEYHTIRCPGDRSLSIPVLDFKIPFVNRNEILNLKDVKVICYDKWQCFLTQHVLYTQNLYKKFPTLYCLYCDNDQEKDIENEN